MFSTLNEVRRKSGGKIAKKLYKNTGTNPNMVGLQRSYRVITSGATTTVHGIGHKLK